MALAYPGANPSQSWANDLVDAINAQGQSYQQWTGTIAAGFTPTTSNYRSLLMSTAVEYTGNGLPDLVLSWNGDCWSPPQDGHYEVHLQVGWDSNSGGNRFCGLLLNPTGNTLNSSSTTGAWKKTAKYAPTSDKTSGAVTWKGWLTTSDRIMCVCRSTVAVAVDDSSYATALSVSFLRSAR